MRRVNYGQNFEDVVLWRALGHIENGRYLDIGAQHPEIDSVSKSFYNAGWRGVNVEPLPSFAEALRADRPDDVVIQAAVGDQHGLMRLYEFTDTGLSTGIAEVAAEISSAGRSFREIQVPSITLDALLAHFTDTPLHWLKIDVEGMEASVLRSWGASVVRPWVVIIESIAPTTGALIDFAWRGLIEDRGYHEVLFDGVNRFFVADEHSELDPAFAAPANCIDNFMVPVHHWSAASVVHHFSIQLAGANADIAERDDQIGSLAAAKDALIGDLHERDDRIGALAAAKDALTGDLQAARDQHQAALRITEERTGHFAKVEADLIAMLGSLTAQLGAASDRIDHAHALVEAGRIREAEAAAAINVLRQEVATAKIELTARTQRLIAADRIITLARNHVRPWPVRLAAMLSPPRHRNLLSLRTALAGWSPNSLSNGDAAATRSNSEGYAMDMFSYDDRNPYVRVDSLAALCSFSDVNFIRCAFVTILGRQPDPSGEAAYTRRLRAGAAKLSIIADLRQSDEGKRHDPGIAGLDLAIRKHRNARLPLIGWFIRQATGRPGDGPVERSLRMLENEFATDRQLATRRFGHLNHFVENIDRKVDMLENILRSALGRGMTSPVDIAEAESVGDGQWESALHKVLDR